MRTLLLFLIFFTSLKAEVQQVTLVWQPGLCAVSCVKELDKQLTRVPGVAKVDINEGSGRAYLTWKPDAPFSFQPLNAAVRYVGIRVNDIHLKVRGRVMQEGNQIKLISSGDNTSFTLLNPVVPQQRQYVVQYNPEVRKLSPQTQADLVEAQKNDWMVTIEGPFFEPYRSPPNMLVVEQMNIDKSKK